MLRALAAATGPLTIAELTAELGGHPNTVRLHLDQLVDSGFVSEVSRPTPGPGRPARGYTPTVAGRQVAAEDADRGQHTALVEAIAEELAAGPDPVAAAHSLGRRWGAQLRSGRGGEGLTASLAGQGFTPTPVGDGLALLTCPLLEVASRRPEVVCQIHQGMIDALADEPMRLLPFAAPEACLVRPVAASYATAARDGAAPQPTSGAS